MTKKESLANDAHDRLAMLVNKLEGEDRVSARWVARVLTNIYDDMMPLFGVIQRKCSGRNTNLK